MTTNLILREYVDGSQAVQLPARTRFQYVVHLLQHKKALGLAQSRESKGCTS